MTALDGLRDDAPGVGKIDPQFFENVIRRRLGRSDPSVIVGPQSGVDCGVLRLGGGQVMALSTDPFFVVPTYGWTRAAWFAVHIIASDVATSGLRPRYLSIDLNLPRDLSSADLEVLWSATHAACDALAITVVTGHTGRYDGCAFPMVGGATMMAVGAEDEYVSVGGSRPGDRVFVTKGAAIEAAALMAATFPDQVSQALGAETAARAEELFWQMSTVKDAEVAVSVGVRDEGVTAMHDATECGVYGGLVEMAEAAGIGMDIDRSQIPVAPEVRGICAHFDMNPYTAISEGSLLLTCRPQAADALSAAFEAQGIPAAEIGHCTETPGVRVQGELAAPTLEHPRVDPFWRAFREAAARAA